jgi:hypothetical protein
MDTELEAILPAERIAYWADQLRDFLQHIYKFTFLCEPQAGQNNDPFDPRETLEIGWFAENDLPEDLSEGHFRRISDAYQARHGDFRAHFDWE